MRPLFPPHPRSSSVKSCHQSPRPPLRQGRISELLNVVDVVHQTLLLIVIVTELFSVHWTCYLRFLLLVLWCQALVFSHGWLHLMHLHLHHYLELREPCHQCILLASLRQLNNSPQYLFNLFDFLDLHFLLLDKICSHHSS